MKFPFSPRTLAILVEAFSDGFSHAELSTEFLRVGADQLDPDTGENKQTRAQRVLVGLRDRGDDESARAALALADELARRGAPSGNVFGRTAASWWQDVIDALAADGWEFDPKGERLVASIPGVEMSTEAFLLEDALIELDWKTAAGHYRQALDAFSVGNWAASNGQLRSFIEDFIPRVAREVTGKRRSDPVAALQALERNGDLVAGEQNFARGLWGMLQSEGPHPGLSDEEEARFRLIATTGYARYFLSRLEDS